MNAEQEIQSTLEVFYRKNAGNLIAILTKIFGPANLKMAEDVVQDAVEAALKHWPEKGIPENPAAWLVQTAKNKALNILKKDKRRSEYTNLSLLNEQSAAAFEQVFTEDEIHDDLLKMMFVCCNPSIGKEAQTSLILKTLCGFSITEIAKAYLTSETTITKRLVRARQTLRELNIGFEIPAGQPLHSRIEGVLETLYLLFNEGYSATQGDQPIRMDICAEAIRLCRLLSEHPSGKNSASLSLLALMCFNTSRFRARVSAGGDLVLLHDQDRSQWNQPLIQSGIHYLQKAADEGVINTYYIQAAISACHCTAPAYEQTDWQEILKLYDLLTRIDNSPVVELNRIVALSKVHGPQKSLEALNGLDSGESMQNYYLFHAVKGEILMELFQWARAKESFQTAASLTENSGERKLIAQKIAACLSE